MGKVTDSQWYWVPTVKPGRMLFGIEGVPPDIAREALRRAANKLPMSTQIRERHGAIYESA